MKLALSALRDAAAASVAAPLGPERTLAAATRWDLSAERQRAKTASPMSVTGMPCSSASMPVHFPVPFCPAVSEIFSTSGVPSVSLCARMAAVISIR